MLFDTMSKMPAFVKSLKRVASKTVFSEGVCASVPTGLKSAAARRIAVLLRFVPVRTQSCAVPRTESRRMQASKKV